MKQCSAGAIGRNAAPGARALAAACAWVPSPRCRPPWDEHPRLQCRAAERDDASPTQRISGGSGGAARPSALALLPDEALQASPELQELCRLQLQLLTAALKLSLQAVLSSSVLGSVGDSMDEELLRQQLLLESSCLRASAYCRAPASLQTGALQLQLVATSEEAANGSSGISGIVQAAQRFLFLGQEGVGGGSLHEQEQWILEQPVIVLPDSGGLVLPLAHNGFLVGLLVVERCLEEVDQLAAGNGGAAAGPAADAGAAGSSSGGSSVADASAGTAAGERGASSSNGSAATMPQPPACLLFRSAEVQLLKQTAAVLALACAMDMRAALERVGAAVRQRQASALVQEAKKPLSMMRTLGTMLLPRLQPGEPDRDFAQGILEQGSRLSEVVSQLQAALHPAASSAVVPPALLAGGSSNGSAGNQLGGRQPQALPGSISSAGGIGSASRSRSSQQLGPQVPARPALPSSSIGSDFQWGSSSSGEAAIDMSIDDYSQAQLSTHQPAAGESGSSNKVASRDSGSSAPLARSAALFRSSGSSSRASADLLNVLMPLLASASNLAAVSGVGFVMAEHSATTTSSSSSSSTDGSAPASAAPQQLVLPAAEVAVGPGTLKRMLSQLIDGIIACAARGDVVQASVQPRQWQGRPGVAITLCCAYGLNHSGGSGAAAAPTLPRPPVQPEFAFLHTTAAEAGGMFEVHTDATPDVAHLNSSALAATLWLPTVPTRGAAWS